MVGLHPDRAHAQFGRDLQVLGDVFHHDGLIRGHVMLIDHLVIGLRIRLGDEIRGRDVENPVEMPGDADPIQHRFGMGDGTVGKDQLAAGQPIQGIAKGRVFRHRAVVDIVHETQKGMGVDIMMGHQSAQRGAIIAEISFLQRPGFLIGDAQKF